MLFYNTALMIAIENQNVDIVKLLLAHQRIDINFVLISIKLL